jgi:tripartite-type tricarboxylate transporter receptor subunit TctC
MKTTRFCALALALKLTLGLTLGLASSAAMAQAYPSKPVKIVIGFGPGSGTDIVARMLADELQKSLGQPFMVENKPGAAAQLAANQVKPASPDGYTLLLTSNTTHSVNPHLYKKLAYDPIADFTPIGGIGFFPFILAVDARIPVKTPQEFVTWAKANKGSVFYAYGTPTVQIPAEVINKVEKLEATGVPYKSSPDAMTDVLGGRAQFMVVDLASSQPQVKAGRLRALAVTSSKRTSLAPDLPTIEETLKIKDFDLAAWTGLFGPANLPKEIVDKLSDAMQTILNRPDVRDRMLANYIEPTPSDPATFKAMVRKQLDVWGEKVRVSGIQPE